MKPVDKSVIDRVLKKRAVGSVSDEPPKTARTMIRSKVGAKTRLIPIDDIYYFFADRKYVTVFYQSGIVKQFDIEESIKSLELDLSDRFIKVHRNALVARNRITGTSKNPTGGLMVHVMNIDKPISVSRRHVPSVNRFIREMAGK